MKTISLLMASLMLGLIMPPGVVIAQETTAVIAPVLETAGPGTRWGVLVVDDAGQEVVSINPDSRFMPASNTKIYTTAAAYWAIANGNMPAQASSGARVYLEPVSRSNTPDVVLAGHGDASLSAAPDCVADCLATLADAIAAHTRRVRNVVGDDTAFPDQRWSPGMSWNNMPTSSGTGISALTINDNEITATVAPAAIGAPPAISVPAYYVLENHAVTVAGDTNTIGYDRMPGSRVLVVTGTIGDAASPLQLRLGVDDPADYAASLLADMLRARGVRITGAVMARHRTLMPDDDPTVRGDTPPTRPAHAGAPLATLDPPELAEDITRINKVSQNLHAELLLRRIGQIAGTGSIADGQSVVSTMLDTAGVPHNAVALYDGSGMSSYNRVSPRGTVTLLRWIARQPWGAAWQATLPVGAQDGTLARRFTDTSLAGRIFAKTGSLNATRALAGTMIARSGKRLTFAIYANDVPADVAAVAIMDQVLVAIAEAN